MLAFAVFILCFFSPCLSSEPELSHILDDIDQLFRSSSSQVKIEMEISTPHWTRTLQLDGWSQEKDKTLTLSNVEEMKKIPTILEMKHLNKEGHKTTIRYLEATFDIPLPEDTFSLRNLKNR